MLKTIYKLDYLVYEVLYIRCKNPLFNIQADPIKA